MFEITFCEAFVISYYILIEDFLVRRQSINSSVYTVRDLTTYRVYEIGVDINVNGSLNFFVKWFECVLREVESERKTKKRFFCILEDRRPLLFVMKKIRHLYKELYD